jgi:FAD/FMN-containing dehydrogenase
MIFVTHQLPVNVPGEPVLDRAAVWDGLVLKANNALPFVPSMTYCEVTGRHSETVFDRDIDFRGQRFTERITLEAPHRVVFTRTAGPVLGTIANEIEDTADGLALRFSFALVVTGVPGGSAAEQDYADSMTADYLKAVGATLAAMRRLAVTSAADPNVVAALIDEPLRAKITAQLAGAFSGDIISPQDEAYGEARLVWNAMIDRRPGLILRCTSTADVVAAVNVAREHGLPPAVRCGGHSVAGKATSEGGLVIDLGGLREVTVDAERKLVHAGGGCLLGTVDAATAPHGLIVPAGIMSETGVAGLALGGGIGWFSRKHGLTCDQFVALEVVLASGEVVEASAQEHPELFWALKGGGGNFGIVTRFTFRAHEFGPLMRIGVSLYDEDHAVDALRDYAALVPTLPRSVGWHAALKHDMPPQPFVPPELVGRRVVMLFSMWLDDAEDPEGAAMIDRLCDVGEPILKASTVVPFAGVVQHLIDEEFADGHRYYTKEAHVAELASEAIDKLVDFWSDMPMEGEVEIIGLGGAIGDVAEDDAAFANRGYLLWLNFAMRWDDADRDEEYIEQTRQIVADLKPWTGQGIYVNMLNFDEMDRVVEAFGGPEKYARLGLIKAQYDPANLFRINYNIPPATA